MSFDFIRLPDLEVEISLHPVTLDQYKAFSESPGLNSSSLIINRAVINVSATEARNFAKRIGARLPTYEEIIALGNYAENIRNVFPYLGGSISCEWLDCQPDYLDQIKNIINCIVIPSGLQKGKGVCARGAIPDQQMSFVTFRLVRG